ncbi:MAG: GTP-dependent dephospho-CoA kinase family protein [Methanoregulaceae archaeon]|nr:GTP-dependent dephospho-CoA kinase family protein [Methanoregulaceae archaeon]
MLLLPESRRHLFRQPFGRLYPDMESLLPLLQGKVVYTVGDVVTYHLIQKGMIPAIAIIDGYTMRSPCNRSPAVFRRRLHARNPPGTLTQELRKALDIAVAEPGMLIIVDGEEDLAVIPLILSAPEGAVVLYGQPGEGVVVCEVTDAAKEKAKALLSCFVEHDEDPLPAYQSPGG